MITKLRIDYRNICCFGVSSKSVAHLQTDELKSKQHGGSLQYFPKWIHRGVTCNYPVMNKNGIGVYKSTKDRARGAVISKVVPSPDLVFDVATIAVMPFYGLMIFGPRSRMTKSMVESSGVFFTLTSVLYGALLVLYDARKLVMPVIEAAMNSAFSAAGSPCMGALATIFKTHEMTAIVWVHLLVLDLFQARWVIVDLGSNHLLLVTAFHLSNE